MEMKKINYMPEIDILRNSSQNVFGALWGAFKVFGCPKRHPDALLAKTMHMVLYSYFLYLGSGSPMSKYLFHPKPIIINVHISQKQPKNLDEILQKLNWENI